MYIAIEPVESAMAHTTSILHGQGLVLSGSPDVVGRDVWGLLQNGVDGLWGGPSWRWTDTENPLGDGSMRPGQVLAEARTLSIRAAHRSNTSSISEMEARDRIAALGGKRLKVTIDAGIGQRVIYGYLKNVDGFVHRDAWTCVFGFQIWCPDPVFVSEYKNFPLVNGPMTVYNLGTARGWPTVVTSGWQTAVEITSGDQTVRLDQACDSPVIQFQSGFAHQGGVEGGGIRANDVTAGLTRTDFFAVEPGETEVTVSVSDPSGGYIQVPQSWL